MNAHNILRENKEHRVVALKDFQAKDFEDVFKRPPICKKKHHEKVLEYYCKSCKVGICIVCLNLEHGGHNIEHLEVASEEEKAKILAQVEKAKNNTREWAKNVGKIERELRHVEERAEAFNSSIEEMILGIRKQQRELITEAENSKKIAQDRLTVLKEKIKKSESVVNQAENLVQRGTSAEIMHSKKQVKEYLEQLVTEEPERYLPQNSKLAFTENSLLVCRSLTANGIGHLGTNYTGELESNEDESETNNEPKFSAIWYYVVTFLVVAIAAIYGFSVVHSEHPLCPGCDPNYDFVKIFENGLQELQTNFTSQTERFWKILKSRGLAHLRTKSPRQPLVLLFMAPPSAHNVADCFTKKLAAKLDPKHSKELTTIDGKDYQTSPGHEAKEKLDKVLSGALQSGHRATLVNHLELLPPPSPLLFYSYCDNDNAPFKHVAILFTVHLPNEPDPSLSAVETEGLVEKFLSSEVWSNAYDKDAIAALLSRIADTVVVLSGEDEAVLSSVCDSM